MFSKYRINNKSPANNPNEIDHNPTDRLWRKIEQENAKSLLRSQQSNNSNSNQNMEINKNLRTIRIFISSTFKDFHNEREVLVTSVFPRLRRWCEQERGLFLIECDLRWGVPSDATNAQVIRYCLEEIEKSRRETRDHNFFLGLIGDRYGWIPDDTELIQQMKERFDWIEESSVTLMEIIHGVIRTSTENCLFMIRSSETYRNFPESHQKAFQEIENSLPHQQVIKLKRFLTKNYSNSQLLQEYTADFDELFKDPISNKERLVLKNLEEFGNTVYEIFKLKIEAFQNTYLKNTINLHELHEEMDDDNLLHLNYLESNNDLRIQRHDYINDLRGKIEMLKVKKNNPIILLTGQAGIGKSTLMGLLIEQYIESDYLLFYHFCGVSSLSNSIINIRKRLVNLLNDKINNKPHSLSSLLSTSDKIDNLKDILSLDDIKLVIFIDGIDEISEFDPINIFSTDIKDNFQIILSCLKSLDSPNEVLNKLNQSKINFNEIPIQPMNLDESSKLINIYLMNYGKRLDSKQLELLSQFKNFNNPLWLLTVCDELRMHGDYSSLTKIIKELPEEIIHILERLLLRILKDEYGDLMKEFLKLLLMSRAGIIESVTKHILSSNRTIESERFNSQIWLSLLYQLKGFLTIQSVPLSLIKFRHRLMRNVVEKQLHIGLDEEKRVHCQLRDVYLSLMKDSREMYQKDYVYHLIKSDSRDKLIEFMWTSESWTLFRQNFQRRQIFRSILCNNPAVQSSQKGCSIKICTFCSTRSQKFSIFSINRNCCFICGTVQVTKDRLWMTCSFHHTWANSQMFTCIICEKKFGISQGIDVLSCNVCSNTISKNSCGVFVREKDIMFRNQLGFSKAAFKIENFLY